MLKDTFVDHLDRTTIELLVEYLGVFTDLEKADTIREVFRGLVTQILSAGVGLCEYGLESMKQDLPIVGGIGLYMKGYWKDTNTVLPPVIYLVREGVDETNKVYCSPAYVSQEAFIKFLTGGTFKLYELAVLAHEFGHHISNLDNAVALEKRDAAWVKYSSHHTYRKMVYALDELDLDKKTVKWVKKEAKIFKRRISNREKNYIFQDEKLAWKNGRIMLRTIVDKFAAGQPSYFIFDFYKKCEEHALETYHRSLWPADESLTNRLCFWKKA